MMVVVTAYVLSFFQRFATLVGWVMDLSWDGKIADGVRVGDFKVGLLAMVAVAWFGAFAAWRLRETHCRNIHRELQ